MEWNKNRLPVQRESEKQRGRHEEWSPLNRMWMFQVVSEYMGRTQTLSTCHVARREEDSGQRGCRQGERWGSCGCLGHGGVLDKGEAWWCSEVVESGKHCVDKHWLNSRHGGEGRGKVDFLFKGRVDGGAFCWRSGWSPIKNHILPHLSSDRSFFKHKPYA